MSRIDAKCSCGAELHARFYLPQNTANCYQAFMDEHAACQSTGMRLSPLAPIRPPMKKAARR